LCINTALTAITHTTTGATGIGAATGLPAGVTATWADNTITISGTPTESGIFNYSIQLTGGCGSIFATGSITVLQALQEPPSVTIFTDTLVVTVGDVLTFTSSAENVGSNPIYQWYVNGNPVNNETDSIFITNEIQNGDAIWLVITITDPLICANEDFFTSNVLVIQVNPDCFASPIEGPIVICGLSTATYHVEDLECATGYLWFVPEGFTISQGQGTNQIIVNINELVISEAEIKLVVYFNNGSDTSNINITRIPFQPVFTSSPTCAILGGTQSFAVIPMQGVDKYLWSNPLNTNILSFHGTQDDSVVLKYGSLFDSGIISVRASNSCGNSPSTEFFILAPPKRPLSIIGASSICTNEPATLFYVDSVNHASYYIWGMPNGATIVSSPVTNDSVMVAFNLFQTGSINVQAANICGSSSMRFKTISVSSVAPASSIDGPLNVCEYVGEPMDVVYSTPLVNGISDYIWTVSSGIEIRNGNGTNTLTVRILETFPGVGQISLKLSNGCNTSSNKIIDLFSNSSQNQFLTNLSISGQTSVCTFLDGAGVAYSVDPVEGITNYNWTISNCESCIINDNGSNQVTILYPSGFVSGTISVVGSSPCGFNTTGSLFVTTLPGNPSGITGPTCVVPGSSYTYSIPAVAGKNVTYNWTAPANASITSGQGSTTITVAYTSSFSAGEVTVTPQNACGTSNTSSVIIGISATTPAAIFGPTSVDCDNVYTYSVDPVPGAQYYIWGVPTGMTIIGSNDGPSIQVAVNFTFISGKINVQSVTGCGSSSMRYTNTITMGQNCTTQLDLIGNESFALTFDQREIAPKFDKVYIAEILNNTLSMSIQNEFAAGSYTVFLVDSLNKVVARTMTLDGGYNQVNVEIDELREGEYQLYILNETNNLYLSTRIVIRE
jgi:hypothetical protein